MIAAHKAELRRKNNLENLSFLALQIKQDRERKSLIKELEKQYYKPHFGPEETDEMLDKEEERIQEQKMLMKQQLVD